MATVQAKDVASAASSHAVAEFNALIRAGRERGASDIHLEPDLPATLRVSSGLVVSNRQISREDTHSIARALLSDDHWQSLLKKGSADLARNIEGVRCHRRIEPSRPEAERRWKSDAGFAGDSPAVDKVMVRQPMRRARTRDWCAQALNPTAASSTGAMSG